MSDHKFQLGDPVVLKGSNTVMTIEDEISSGRYLCVWIDDKNKPQQAICSAHSLDLFDDGMGYNDL